MKKCKSQDWPNEEPDYYYACDREMNHEGKHLDKETGREWGDDK